MALPRNDSFDDAPAFFREGYEFISTRCREFAAPGFKTRLGLRPVTVLCGKTGAEAFYRPGRFTRQGAVPPTVVTLLQDKGSVQSLDGDAHHARKATWMRMVASPHAVAGLCSHFGAAWERFEERFTEERVLHDELRRMLTEAALHFAGLDLPEAEIEKRTREMGAMIDGAGSIGLDQAEGQLLRRRSEAWAGEVMRQAFADPGAFGPDSIPAQLVAHREADGSPLDLDEATVELINAIRPVAAVARFIVFAALTLYERPEWHDALRGDPGLIPHFVTEVRRLAPFFPAIGGIALESFEFEGETIAEGDWVVLDIYGSNRDPAVFENPERFHPERFKTREPDPWDMIPQGGGPYETTHRCPGEKATAALIEEAVRRLLELRYEVPEQDLRVALDRFPALPESGFRIAPQG